MFNKESAKSSTGSRKSKKNLKMDKDNAKVEKIVTKNTEPTKEDLVAEYCRVTSHVIPDDAQGLEFRVVSGRNRLCYSRSDGTTYVI